MPIVAADWSVTRSNGNIRYIGDDHNGAAPSYATVIEFHRWLAGLADDATSSGDDEVDITDANPSDRSTDNIITLLGSYNIDDNASEHLYDGSIIQGSGTTQTIYDGVVNFGNATVQIQIHQDGAVIADDWWNKSTGGSHDGSNNASVLTDSGESWTTDEWVGYTIYNTTDGSRALITANTATTITGTLYGGTENDWDTSDAYLIGKPLNADAGSGISHRFMIKTRDEGVDIDRRRLVGVCRRYGNTFAEFKINGTSRGNNVLALVDATDLNNSTAYATIDALADISNTEGLRLIDLSGDSVNEEYYSEWDIGANSINTFYEKMKKRSADGTPDTLNGQSGELFRGLTHWFGYDGETGTMFSTNDEVVWGTAIICDGGTGTFTVGEAVHEDTATPTWKGRVMGGDLTIGAGGTLIVDVESGTLANNDGFTGQSSSATADINDASPPSVPTSSAGRMALYAIDDNGTDGELYGQILRGVAPAENQRIYDDTATANYVDVDENAGATPVTELTVSTPFCGVSTGTALIGAFGFAIEAADASASDIFTDLAGNTINPPNNVTFTVSGLVSSEDRVIVANNDGGDIDYNQFALNTTLNGAAETAVVITTTIPGDTPSTGTIRIQNDEGLYRRVAYTSWTGSTFTIGATDFSGSGEQDSATAANNVFISYIDETASGATASFTGVYQSDRTLFVRVRDGAGTPIKPFETTGTLGSNGGSATAIRTSDA